MKYLEERVRAIEDRNRLVEAEKAWEVSLARRGILLVLTYIAIGVYLNLIKVSEPWIAAIVPALAFTISTLSMPFFKKIWLSRKKI